MASPSLYAVGRLRHQGQKKVPQTSPTSNIRGGGVHSRKRPTSVGMIPFIDDILKSCSSITKTALAAKTLGSKNQETKNIDELIANEINIREWLKRQSIDLIPLSQGKAAKEAGTCRHKYKCLQEDLMDATLRQQQEDLLIKRLRMATSYPANDLHQKCLVDEGLQAVYHLEQAAVEKRQKLASLLSQIYQAEEERQRIHEENQDKFQQLYSKGGDTVTPQNTSETLTLKRVLQDIIVSSHVDIHHDKRLQEALIRCERP